MSIMKVEMHPVATHVEFTDAEMTVSLADGRIVSVPLAWFSSLSQASTEELEDFELLGDGEGIHWPTLDEDLSVKGLLLGVHA